MGVDCALTIIKLNLEIFLFSWSFTMPDSQFANSIRLIIDPKGHKEIVNHYQTTTYAPPPPPLLP